MKWAQSLIRIADHQVDELQKRLAEIMERRANAALRLTMLQAEAEAERAQAVRNAESGWYSIGFVEGWRWRRDELTALIEQLAAEEAGARDALGLAFEDLKKFEQVAETARVAAAKEDLRKEIARMDELGRRRAHG